MAGATKAVKDLGMDKNRYQEYIAAFNARDYDRVCSFFTPDVVIYTEGHAIRGQQGIRDFYQFFHAYVDEKIQVTKLVSDENHLFAEGVMHLTGLKTLDQATLNQKGFPNFVEVPKGLKVTVNLWLHYDVKNGLFNEIRCTSYLPADDE